MNTTGSTVRTITVTRQVRGRSHRILQRVSVAALLFTSGSTLTECLPDHEPPAPCAAASTVNSEDTLTRTVACSPPSPVPTT